MMASTALFGEDLYDHYQELREQGPICWSDEFFGGAWVLTTYDAVSAALRDPRLSAQRTGGWLMRGSRHGSARRERLTDMQRLFAKAMLFLDKPAHPRLRRAMQAGFRAESIQSMAPFVTDTANALVDRIEREYAGNESFDFVEHFATMLPARVIAHFLGFPEIDHDRFQAWTADIARFLGSTQPEPEIILAARDSILAMTGFIEAAISHGDLPEGGMLANLVEAQRRGEIEGGDELLAQCAMLLFAGQETTRHLLATSVYWLLQDPALWQSLQDPKRLRTAVRELLRWDSPVQYTGRRANRAFTLLGRDIRRNDLVLPLIGSANRDPARYEDPDCLDLDRSVGMPLSFGTGPHVCIGASMTLLEAECALGVLTRRWPDASLGGPPQWLDQPLYRGFEQLPLRRS